MKNKATRNNMRGFSLMEMLVTVLILVILFALAMIPISKIQKNLRQTELDSRAEMIFSAVQNRMTRLQAAGQDSYYQPTSGVGVKKLDMIPKDADKDNNYEPTTLAYVTSDDKDNPNSAASWIYPETEAEADLWDGNWVVEFDPSSGSVYAVFFSREDMNYTPESFDKLQLRDRDKRLENGAKVGYYGGDSVGAAATESLDLTVDVINKDQLLVVASCKVNLRNKPQFYAVIKDEFGHTVQEFEIKNDTNTGDTVETDKGTATLVLDNLSEGKRFGQQDRFKDLIPGENLTVTIRVKDANNNQIQGTSKTVTTNSLFAEVRDDASGIGGTDGRTAVIKYGRHLQNLEENSGLNRGTDSKTPAITAAVQERDIQFKSDESDSWGVLYPKRNFVPLVNSKIKSYRSKIGSYCPVIYDLTVNTTGDAGLFKTFAGELKNIRLAGAQITGKQTVSTKFNRDGNVGGLVGKLTGETTIDGCQVYLSRAKGQLNGKKETDIWIDGAVSGGLVGDAGNNNLTVENSLAATVINGTEKVGGLIGYVADNIWLVDIQNSYADCYLSSNLTNGCTGGLIGDSDTSVGVATRPINLLNCYAAGFLKGKTTAGFSTGTLYNIENCYSACVPLDADKLTYETSSNSGIGNGAKVERVYYLGETENPATTIGTPINYSKLNAPNADTLFASGSSNAFTRQNSDTYAYNLMKGLGLTLYSYPKLNNLPHYGDWKAEFEEGALVYYERYNDDSYGFFGANVEALSDKPVTGDGYGVVYEKNLPDNNVTVTVGSTVYTLDKNTKITITVTGKDSTPKTYYLLPLPADLVQKVETVPTGFYTKLMVGGTAGKAYYYNPHFAKTALAAKTGAPELVSIRTARQLYALSEYYNKYADEKVLHKDAAFQQERGIDYDTYNWKDYGKGGKAVTQQAPIGQTEDAPFKHRYDGGSHIITGVSFASGEDGHAVGLFGFTTGTLENIVVTTVKPLENAPTSKLGGNVQWKTVYTGVLAGKNSGTIKNCAVSGYRLSGSAYSGSTYYLGGLVGCNEGLIQACSADIPSITGTSTYARSYCAGGLVGMNDGSGYIRQSYALGSIKLTEIRGSAMISGFVGDNQGTIRNSYCATALTAVTGAEVNGFTSDHGSVSDCYYLSGGTYTFAGTVRLYDYKAGTNGAKAQNHKQMKALKLDGFATVDKEHSLKHQNTDPSETVYPYPSSVTAGSAKTRVHYGDWPTPADMGTIGMVYWEKEEGGANSGYHFSYIGFTGDIRKTGSSLCTAHDDGGKITDFGYGYYYKDGTSGNLTPSVNFVLGAKNAEAQTELAKQVSGYTFTCYRTDGENGLQLSAETKSNSDSFTLAANGTWTLNQNGKPYTYAVCPFFGDSYCPVEDVGNAQDLGKTGAKKQYQIRSVEQLQFINWSCEVTATYLGPWWNPKYSFTFYTGTDRPVTSKTYNQFPYLQYATVTEQGEQKMSAALSNCPQRSWTQTHDLNGMALNAPADGAENTVFYPIAGAVDNHTGSDYNVVLYTWFGGQYNGGNYYIKNIAINSYCYNVGVFGTTAGATIENIMLYSDNNGVIQRSTGYTPKGTSTRNEDQYQCAYALGGLVGIAYDYQDNLGKSTIQNCAIAGYTVADNSKNKQQLGEAVVGGLIGVSNVNLMKCTAVVDIQINCTHRDNNENGALNAPQYGTFVRVGGIAGGVRYSVTDCYSGGTITVGNETLRERVGNESGSLLDAKTLQFTNNTTFNMSGGSSPATYIFLGGIGGSGFSSNFVNFTGSTSVIDGQPTYKNCYTYVIFPKLEGTINGISLIGSVADRFGQAERLTIQNCYYLADSAKIDFSNALRAKGDSAKSSLADVYGGGTSNTAQEAARKRMLQGDLGDMASVMWGSGKDKIYSIGLTERTYAQMSNRSDKTANNFQKKLGNGFGWVTNMENGSTIHGKYSFPGSDAALQGQDYPFPTVLRGTDSTGVTVNLHYGAWPKVGMLWNEGIVSLDLIADYVPSSGATKELKLNLFNVPEGTGTKSLEFTYSPEGVVTAKATKNETGDFAVTLKGEGTGAAEVIAKYGDYTARLMVTVTADLKVNLGAESVELNVGNEKAVQIKAVDKKNQAHTATWTVTSDNQEVAAVTEPADGQIKVTGVTAGETQLRITATCTVGGKDYTATAILPVTVKGDDTSITPDPGSGD